MNAVELLKDNLIHANEIQPTGGPVRLARAKELAMAALAECRDPKHVLDEGLIKGMDVVGAALKQNEIYIPEVLVSVDFMKAAMEVLEPELVKAGVKPLGKFLIGTVQGDLHDIGKNLVAMMMKGLVSR